MVARQAHTHTPRPPTPPLPYRRTDIRISPLAPLPSSNSARPIPLAASSLPSRQRKVREEGRGERYLEVTGAAAGARLLSESLERART